MSYAEELFEEALHLTLTDSEEVLRNYRPDWLRNYTGKSLEYDFYLPKWKVAFEIQGQHHYDDCNQKYRDTVKEGISKEKGIALFNVSIFGASCSLIRRLLLGLAVSGKYIPLKPFNIEKNKIQNEKLKEYSAQIKFKYGKEDCQLNPKQIRKEEIKESVRNFCKNKKYFELEFKGQKAIFEYVDMKHKVLFKSRKFGFIHLSKTKFLEFLSESFKGDWVSKYEDFVGCTLNWGVHTSTAKKSVL